MNILVHKHAICVVKFILHFIFGTVKVQGLIEQFKVQNSV